MAVQLTHSWTGADGDPWDASVWELTIAGSPSVEIDTASGDATGRGLIDFNSSSDRVLAHLDSPLNLGDTRLQVTIRTSNANQSRHLIFLRATGPWSDDDPTDGYRFQIDWAADNVIVRRYVGGATADLNTTALPAHAADTDYIFVAETFEDAGSTRIRWKFYAASGSDPGTWNADFTDSNASRPATGSIGLGGARVSGSNNIYFDDLIVDDLATGPVVEEVEVEGTLTPSGTIVKEPQISDSGSLSPAGELMTDPASLSTLEGTLSPVGSTVQESQISLSGSLGSTGAVQAETAVKLEVASGKMLNTRFSVSSFTNTWWYQSTDGSTFTPTLSGSPWNEAAKGKIPNLRCVQAAFEHAGGTGYPEPFDPAQNTADFIAALPTYAAHGVIGVTIGLQGGNPNYGTNGSDHDIGAFNPDGSLRAGSGTPRDPQSGSWMDRLNQILLALRENGMFCIINLFYHGQDQRLTDNDAVRAAVDNVVDWLVDAENSYQDPYQHVLWDIANEYSISGSSPLGFQRTVLSANGTGTIDEDDDEIGALVLRVQNRYTTTHGLSWRAPVSCSHANEPTDDFNDNLLAVSDFACVHLNSTQDFNAEDTFEELNDLRSIIDGSSNPNIPILVNEDDELVSSTNDYANNENLANEAEVLEESLEADASPGTMLDQIMQYYQSGTDGWWIWAEGTAGVTESSRTQADHLADVLDLYQTALTATIEETEPAGTLSPSGNLIQEIEKFLAGTLSPSGLLEDVPLLERTGTLGTTGTVVSTPEVLQTGTLDLAGEEQQEKGAFQESSGTLSFTGIEEQSALKEFTGTISFAGAEQQQTSAVQELGGVLTLSGVEQQQKMAAQALSGTLSPSGAINRLVFKSLSALLGSSGTIVKGIPKVLGSTLGSSGSLQTTAGLEISVSGVLGSSGLLGRIISRTLVGTVSPTGEKILQAQVTQVGTLAPEGSEENQALRGIRLLEVEGALALFGQVGFTVHQVYTGLLALGGTTESEAQISKTGSLSPNSTLETSSLRELLTNGILTSSGLHQITNRSKRASGTLGTSGLLESRGIFQILTGTLSSVGLVQFFSEAISFPGALEMSDRATAFLQLLDRAAATLRMSDRINGD